MFDNVDADNPVKEYTGVWIPAEVMESDELEPLDKLVYGEIAGFNECYASNAWLAKKVKRSERTVRDVIKKLVDLGFVENIGFNGRLRRMRVAKFCRSAWQNSASLHGEISPHNNKVENKDYISTKVDSAEAPDKPVEKSEYGNHEVNALIELWEHETGITANVAKANRLAAYNLLRRKGFDGAKATVELVGRAIRSGDPYAPRVASFRDLQGQYEKLSKLEAWEARCQASQPAETPKYWSDEPPEFIEVSDDEREKVREMMKAGRKQLPFIRPESE